MNRKSPFRAREKSDMPRALRILILGALSAFGLFGRGVSASPDTIPVSEIREGMRGYGLTVFSGVRIDTFQVEILAVLRSQSGPSDAIVARVSGGPLAETGVAQGMSGSPVYLNGRLAGAIAWTSTFSKSPIAGITPIQDMLEIPTRPMTPPPRERYAVVDPSPARASLQAPPLLAAGGMLTGTDMVPIKTPVSVAGGGDSRTLAYLQQVLDPYGMSVVQGGSGSMSSDSLRGARLIPGASLAVTLIRGDINVAGVGTVTWADSTTVIGFGHPMFFKGHVDLPMSLAYVHFLWPSQVISYKVASQGPVVGALRQDRASGVAGVLNERPDMLPVEIRIAGGPRPRTVHFEVVRETELSPSLITFGVLASLSDFEALGIPSSVEMTQKIEVEGRAPVRRKNFFTDFGGLVQAAQAGFEPLMTLARNPFEPVRIARVIYDIAYRENIEAAFIKGLEIPRRVVRAGEPLIVTTVFQTYLGRQFEKTVELPIPTETPDGVYLLRIGGADAAQGWTTTRTPGRFVPDNLDQLIRLLNYEERTDNLTLEVLNRDIGMTVDDQELPSLPPSMFELMRSAVPGGRIGPVLGSPVVRKQEQMGLYVIGSQEITVAVYRFARPR
jgi:hypothetical protein